MRRTHRTRIARKASPTVKRLYQRSWRNIKKHPTASGLGILTLGAGLLSGVYILFKLKK
jgi:hypothetical protein